MAQTIATSLEKLNTALEGDKTALTAKKVTVPSTAKHSDIPKLIATVTNGMSAKITVNCSEEFNGTTLTFKNGSNVITAQVVGGKCEVSPDKEGTWTITNTLDDQLKTCVVEFNYYELELYAKPITVEICSAKDLNKLFVDNYYGKKYDLKFCHEKAPSYGTTDISKNKDKSILMWLDGTTVKISTQDEKKKVHFSETSFENGYEDIDWGSDSTTQGIFINGYWQYDSDGYGDGSYYYRHYNIFINIDMGDVDFSDIKSINHLFDECDTTVSLDMSKVTGLDSGSLTSMDYAFYNMRAITSIKLPRIDTTNVKTMGAIFAYLGYNSSSPIGGLDLSSWKTDKVTGFGSLFAYCNVKTIDISNFKATSLTTKLYRTFYYCKATTIYCNNDWTSNSNVSSASDIFTSTTNLSGSKGTTGAYCKPADLGGNFTRK